MTLLELLVKELTEIGGWPSGFIDERVKNLVITHNIYFGCDAYGAQYFENDSGDVVTRDQYEAALAASQQPVWGGEGLPSVGVECEALCCFIGSTWKRVILKWSNEKKFLYEWVREGHPVHHSLAYVDQHSFRPIRTEAERKREEVGQALYEAINWAEDMQDYNRAYDAIASGKIPGVELSK